jgi:threonine synthase
MSAARVVGLECLRCSALFEGAAIFTGCPRCRERGVAASLSVKLDLSALHGLTREALPATPRSLWRYRALMPVTAEPVSLGEGATPLIHLDRLGRRLGFPRLYAKDESQNPTWSYKDRLCSVAVTHAVQTGARVITISSTGNHGASTAAYAARAGLPCVIFTLASVPDTMKTLMQAYGAAVVACATSEARWALMRQGIERFGWYPTSGFQAPPVGSNPYGVDGYKTIAYEIAEDLGWVAPDVVIVPSAYSDGLFGVWKGFSEMQALGLVKTAPRMIAAEPFGPLAHAIDARLDAPEVVEGGSSVAFSIASRYGTYQGLAALKQSGGLGVRITDEGVFEAQRALAREEGVFAEPSSAAALTALMQLRAQKAIDPEQTIVIVSTSSGLKDFAASRTWMSPVPDAPADFDGLLHVLREHYGLALDR